MKIDLDLYDRIALNMRMPKMAVARTTPLTQLPDDFEPPTDEGENLNLEAEDIGKLIP